MCMVRLWGHRGAITRLRRILVHHCRLRADTGGRLSCLVYRCLHLKRGRRRMRNRSCILRVFERNRMICSLVVGVYLGFRRDWWVVVRRVLLRPHTGVLAIRRVESLNSNRRLVVARRRILLRLLWRRQTVLRGVVRPSVRRSRRRRDPRVGDIVGCRRRRNGSADGSETSRIDSQLGLHFRGDMLWRRRSRGRGIAIILASRGDRLRALRCGGNIDGRVLCRIFGSANDIGWDFGDFLVVLLPPDRSSPLDFNLR